MLMILSITTLPNTKCEIEDDPYPSGNGYYDETEVVSLSPTQMKANTDYRFESYFWLTAGDSNASFGFSSSENKRSLTGEYNVVYNSPHLTRSYPF